MEAQASSSSGDSTANGGGAPQPQRERKPPRARGERNGQAKTFYKTDGELSDAASDGGDKQPQDKKVQKTQGNRSEKVYLPKGTGESSNGGGEANGGDSREERPKTRPQKGKEGGKKKLEKKRDENEVARIVANERFDNSSFVDNSEASRDPHRALQISEATRLQEIVPSGVSKEVQEKVKRIQEVIGDLEFHVVYGALEDLGYDEEKTVSFFLDKKPAMVKKEPAKERKPREREEARRAAPQTNQRWTSIVKKGLKTQYGVYDENASQEPEVEEYNQQPQQQPRHRTARASQPQEASQPSFAQRLAVTAPNGQSMDSETLVTSLTMAIASQLKMIHEQTRMLTAMQNELANITQAGSSEKEQLLNEQEMLRQREAQLLEELEDVRNRMEETDRLLAENQKKKVERLSSITQNNFVAHILRTQAPAAQGSQPAPQQAPAAHSGDQQQHRPQQQRPQQRERAERHQRDRWERTDNGKARQQNRRNQDRYT